MHHCSRDADQNPVSADRINPMSRFDVYVDERHEEPIKPLAGRKSIFLQRLTVMLKTWWRVGPDKDEVNLKRIGVRQRSN